MSSWMTAGLVFGCALVAAIAAMLMARRLPEKHLNSESKDVVKLGLGVIATLTALVLGLLVASSKGTYDAQETAVKQLAASVGLLDRYLSAYGKDAQEARELLHRLVESFIGQTWPEGGTGKPNLSPESMRDIGDEFYRKLTELQPKTEAQRLLKGRALDVTVELAQTRQRMQVQRESSVPWPFLVVLVLWLVTMFVGYGLLAPPNTTVISILVVCALSISAALFLVLELGKPFDGIIQVPNTPLQETLSRIGK